MTRATILLAALIVLHGAPASAYEVGDQIGPVTLRRAVLCNTAEEARQAIDLLNGVQTEVPAGCGDLLSRVNAIIEIVGHHESAGDTYAIGAIHFIPPWPGGPQYSWMIDRDEEVKPEGTSV